MGTKRRIVLALLLLVVGVVASVPPVGSTASATPAQAPPTKYNNWLFNGDNPSILRTGTAAAPVYYAYVSGFEIWGFQFGARVFRSTNLAQWEDQGNALPLATAGTWADRSSGLRFSSPSVREIGTNPAAQRFVMYFTGIQSSTGNKCIGVATSSSPTGPFVGAASPLICPTGGVRDPSSPVLPDGLGFQEVVYVKNSGSDAGIYNQVLTQDGLALHPNWSPLLLYKAQPNWWHEGVVDRPSLVGDGQGGAYLFFTGGTPDTGGRAVGWSSCAHLGIVVDCHSQTVLGTWFGGTSQVSAPGGVQPFTDGQGNAWITYKALGPGCSPTGPCTGTPSVHIDKLCFAHGFPRTNAPTSDDVDLARSANCSTDIPGKPLTLPATVTDTGTALGTPTAPIYIDGLGSAAVGGKSLWTFGDSACPSGLVNNTAGFGVPNAAAEAPNYVQHNCASMIPRTADEIAFETSHAPCSSPASGTCTWSRLTHWGGVTGLPDGSGVALFSKTVFNYVRTWNGSKAVDTEQSHTNLGVGLAHITKANVDAGIPVADRSRTVSPVACNPTTGNGATSAGCLFNETLDPSNSDRFWRPYIEGEYLYLFSDFFWAPYGNTKVARAKLSEIDTPGAWRYWGGQGPEDWRTTYAQAADVPGLQAGRVFYSPYLDKYVNTWADLGHAIDIQTADSLTGQWSPLQRLYNLQECPEMVSYAASLHPELASEGGRVLPLAYIKATKNQTTCPGVSRYAEVKLN